jgi:anaerobic carbon-monoxide dehydrogenase iron sulfur subunit
MKLSVIDANLCVGCQSCMFACSRRNGHAGLSNACIGVKSAGGISRGFSIIVCRSCENPPCARACPVGALKVQEKGGVRLDASKCIGCAMCKEACIIGAVFWNEEKNKPVICVQCGICADFCPYQVLKLNKK